jgi:hypothetical protein
VVRFLDHQLTAAEVAALTERLRGDETARREAAALLLQVGILGEMAREPRLERLPWRPRPRKEPSARSRRMLGAMVAIGAGLAAATLVLLVARPRLPVRPSPSARAPVVARPAPGGKVPVRSAGTRGHALLIGGSDTEVADPRDALMIDRLEGLGFAVSTALDTSVSNDDLSGKSLVVISASASGDVLREQLPALGLRQAPVPIVTCESASFELLGMTGPRTGHGSGNLTGFGSAPGHAAIQIESPGHALAAGLSGRLSIAGAPVSLSWGVPAESAIRVASLGGRGQHLVVQFAYEREAGMVGLTAPARRVGCFVSADASDALTPEGWRLFEAGVRWAAGF